MAVGLYDCAVRGAGDYQRGGNFRILYHPRAGGLWMSMAIFALMAF